MTFNQNTGSHWGATVGMALLMCVPAMTLAQSIRKDYREFTDAEMVAYLNAFNKMWDGGTQDTVESYAQIHAAVFDSIHGSENPQRPFLPWHRELLYQFEKRLRIHDPDVTIPFWNWTEVQSPTADLWVDWMDQYNDPSFYYWNLDRDKSGPPLPRPSDVDYILDRDNFPEFTRVFEHGDIENGIISHDSTHVWVGGQMALATSPRDSVFLFSHCFIDNIWQDWVNTEQGRTAMETWIDEVHTFNGQTGTGWVETNMDCSAGDIQWVDPDLLWDSRIIRDVWYADYDLRLVTLDRHTVPTVQSGGAKTYRYTTGVIEAKNDFVVPSGADCTFEASDGYAIVLKPGFRANEGSTFLATITAGGMGKIIADASKPGGTETQQQSEADNDELGDIPQEFSLKENYPNPFNAATAIRFGLPRPTYTRIVIYDLLGREVVRLADRTLEPGYHSVVWDGRSAAGGGVPSGVYIARLATPEYTQSIKMLMLK